MDFDLEKEKYMAALSAENYSDLSKKGSVDTAVVPLLSTINSLPDYFTTSSCAGRISLFALGDSGRKDAGEWLLVTHSLLSSSELVGALDAVRACPRDVFFHQETCILHVCCRTLLAAQDIVDKARFCGFKRSGIMSTRKRIMVELLSTERVNTIVARGGQVLVSDSYLEELRLLANRRLSRTREKMEKFRLALENDL